MQIKRGCDKIKKPDFDYSALSAIYIMDRSNNFSAKGNFPYMVGLCIDKSFVCVIFFFFVENFKVDYWKIIDQILDILLK